MHILKSKKQAKRAACFIGNFIIYFQIDTKKAAVGFLI